MITVGAYEAKTHLSELLAKVEAGERVIITKHNRAVAALVPVQEEGRRPVDEVLAELFAFGDDRELGDDLSLRDLIEEGRR